MVFSSLGFIYLFLPAVIFLHAVAPQKLKNSVLLIASLAFYFVGEQLLTLVMIASAVVDYFCSLGIERFREKKWLCRVLLLVSIVFNISVLAYFKYADLLIDSFNLLTGASVPLLRVALPIGISFYTFQTMSYTADVYRGKTKAERNFIDFATYVTIFPQLVAGPIVRYEDVACDLEKRRLDISECSLGIRRFCAGLGKKVLIANSLAELSKIYSGAESHTVLLAWICAVAAPLQIYFDFSGYSDMAIGLGHMLGFHFPENFDYPFSSKSATEFWRRWHITLGRWFADYVYIPLGGNRVKPFRHIVNLLIVWAITGLWHGAEYNFILWGLWYGVLIVFEKYVYGKYLEKSKIFSRIYFIIITVIGFEIFSASGVSDILSRTGELFGIGVSAFTDAYSLYYLKGYLVPICVAIVFSLPVIKKFKGKLEASPAVAAAVDVGVSVISLLLLIFSTAYLVDGSYNPFLYFRF